MKIKALKKTIGKSVRRYAHLAMLPSLDSTFCVRLWENVYIDNYGLVYSCCRNRPLAFGNIYIITLSDILNNPYEKKFRRLSQRRRLYCYKRCTLLSEEEKRRNPAVYNPGEEIHIHDLTKIWILFSEKCNIRCTMCFQNHAVLPCLSSEIVASQIDWDSMNDTIDIVFQGGEPLAIKSCRDSYVWLTQEKNKKVNFITNGLLIDDFWAERLCLGLTWLSISVNAAKQKTHELINRGSQWDKVIANIKRLQRAKERLGSSIMINGHMTIIPQNINEIGAFIKLMSYLGMDSVDFGFDKGVPKYLQSMPSLKYKLAQDIEEAAKNSSGLLIKDLALRNLGLVAKD